MTYREILEKARSLGPTINITIANECDSTFEFDYTEDDFEWLCDKIKATYLKTDSVTLEDIVYTINLVITNEEKTIKDILNLTHWELLELTVDKRV